MGPISIQKDVKIYLESPEEVMLLIMKRWRLFSITSFQMQSNITSREEGLILLSERHQDRVNILIRDTGIGMGEDDVPRLFEEFVRIKNEQTKNITGSGLGLSIVKKLALNLYKGDIRVESKPGEGSTFMLEFPQVKF
jgi:two-component system, sensor histidine kinase and response regulator